MQPFFIGCSLLLYIHLFWCFFLSMNHSRPSYPLNVGIVISIIDFPMGHNFSILLACRASTDSFRDCSSVCLLIVSTKILVSGSFIFWLSKFTVFSKSLMDFWVSSIVFWNFPIRWSILSSLSLIDEPLPLPVVSVIVLFKVMVLLNCSFWWS